MSIFVWTLVGIAIWHFTVFVPDRFAGGIVGAFLAAWFGAVVSGIAFAGFTFPTANPPGTDEVLFALPGALLGLAACYGYGVRSERRIATPDEADRVRHRVGNAAASRAAPTPDSRDGGHERAA